MLMQLLDSLASAKDVSITRVKEIEGLKSYINTSDEGSAIAEIADEMGDYPRQDLGSAVTGYFRWTFTLDGSAIAAGGQLIPDLRAPNPAATAPIQANGGQRSGNFYPGKVINTGLSTNQSMFMPLAVCSFTAEITSATSVATQADLEAVRIIQENAEIVHIWVDGDVPVPYALPLSQVSHSQLNSGRAIAGAVNPAATFLTRDGSRVMIDPDGLRWGGDPVFLAQNGNDRFYVVCNNAVPASTAGNISVTLTMFGALVPNVSSPKGYRASGRCGDGKGGSKQTRKLLDLIRMGARRALLLPGNTGAARFARQLKG